MGRDSIGENDMSVNTSHLGMSFDAYFVPWRRRVMGEAVHVTGALYRARGRVPGSGGISRVDNAV